MDDVGIALQKTLKSAIHCRGVALHSGARVGHDAASGRAGHRHRLPPHRSCRRGDHRADWRNVVESGAVHDVSTTAKACRSPRSSICMAALAGLEIDNALDRARRAGSAGHGRQRRALRLPDRMRRRRRAGRAAPRHQGAEAGDRRRWTARSASARRRMTASRMSFAIDFASGAISRQDITIVGRPRELQERDQPRPHLRLPRTRSIRCAPPGWRAAARSTTPWSSAATASSTGGAALRRRVRAPQGARRAGRSLPRRRADDRPFPRRALRPCAQSPAARGAVRRSLRLVLQRHWSAASPEPVVWEEQQPRLARA